MKNGIGMKKVGPIYTEPRCSAPTCRSKDKDYLLFPLRNGVLHNIFGVSKLRKTMSIFTGLYMVQNFDSHK